MRAAAAVATLRLAASGIEADVFSVEAAAAELGVGARRRGGSGDSGAMEVGRPARSVSRSSSDGDEEEEEEFQLDDGSNEVESEENDHDDRVSRNRAGDGNSRTRSSSSSAERGRTDTVPGGRETEDNETLARVPRSGGGGIGSAAAVSGVSNGTIDSSTSQRGRGGDGRDGGGDGNVRGGGRYGGVGGSAGPNFWPRVLESASSAVAPRHVFDDDDADQEEGMLESDGEEGPPAGAAGVVAQSWADARLAEQVRCEAKGDCCCWCC